MVLVKQGLVVNLQTSDKTTTVSISMVIKSDGQNQWNRPLQQTVYFYNATNSLNNNLAEGIGEINMVSINYPDKSQDLRTILF